MDLVARLERVTQECGMELTDDTPIWKIALLIESDWKNIYFGAVQYIEAMSTLDEVDDTYGVESGNDIIRYFLANAMTWRGSTARAIKKHLNARVKNVY
jgi:hypothetical protein